jgi:hypothetical protein
VRSFGRLKPSVVRITIPSTSNRLGRVILSPDQVMIALHQLTAKQSESQRSDLRFHTNHLNSLYQDVQFSVTCRRDGTSTGCFCIFESHRILTTSADF